MPRRRVCVAFASDGRLMAGESFTLKLPRGLEFTLKGDRNGSWAIIVSPVEPPFINFFDLTPPLQYRPHAYVGPVYIKARESVGMGRDEPFVVTRRDFDEVDRTVAESDAGTSLATIARLATGRLLLRFPDYGLVLLPDGSEELAWITLSGKICIPPE